MIEIKKLKKLYGDRTVLDIPELIIKKGECVILTGHNGSGKTTLIKILAGTLGQSEGEVQKEGSVYYLPQQSLPFNMSVRKNILYCLEGSRKSKNEAAERLLEALKLKELESKNAKTLSGGECQRLSLARVLTKKADILLLDEPTSAADAESRRLINEVIAEYYRKTGCTLVMITHTEEFPPIENIRVIKLCDGKITEDKEEK